MNDSVSDTPNHVAFILDGNRRWARENGFPTLEGHRQGYDNLKTIARAAFESGVGYVSAFVFSTENWNRSKEEVGYLMQLALKIASKDAKQLAKENIRIAVLGIEDRVPVKVMKAWRQAEADSKDNTGGTLALCFNYGGRQEIVDAVKNIVASNIDSSAVSETVIADALYKPEVPPIDLMIRTSGEQRLSNFMLWRLAYAELYFVEKHWPAFSVDDLKLALADYAQRHRRFGAD